MNFTEEPVGAVLAGGAGTRLGGAKATATLAGRPLLAYPVAALAATLRRVAVVAKRDTALPELGEVPVWLEPDEPRHPLTGLLAALRRAEGRAVLACAADLPFVGPDLVGRIASAPAAGAPALVPRVHGRAQPLLARYEPEALAGLRAADPTAPLTETVLALGPALLDLADDRPFFNVNTPADLRVAQEFFREEGKSPQMG